jgi:hypothetical protein
MSELHIPTSESSAECQGVGDHPEAKPPTIRLLVEYTKAAMPSKFSLLQADN